jgi:signal transduction histidine kinase
MRTRGRNLPRWTRWIVPASARRRRPSVARTMAPSVAPSVAPTTGYLQDDAAPPATLRLQLNALQALSRQTIAVRLTMLAIGTPFAMANTSDGAPTHAVLIAAALGITISYATLRDWDRFAPRLLAHPSLMVLDLVLGAVLLLTASPVSPLAYATVCTPLLSGLLYGWRGAGLFTGLQLAVLLTVHRAWEHSPGAGAGTLLIAGFCVAAGIIGVTLRNLMFRFGTATQALAEATSRLAVAEAVESERARLARELHDSVAKTLHGLALAADALSTSADRPAPDPAVLRRQAALVAAAARRAAAESRDLLTDLRRHTDLTETRPPADLTTQLTAKTTTFTTRTTLPTHLTRTGPEPPPLPPETTRHLLAIVTEALENTHRHARATRADVTLTVTATALRLTIKDDGVGLPPVRALAEASDSGHFGLVGMRERAEQLGAHLHIAPGTPGTEVTLTLPLREPPADTPRPSRPLHQESAHA